MGSKGPEMAQMCAKKAIFSWVSGLRPRTTRRQASSRQASSSAKLLKLGQNLMKEKANGCQHKASYLTGLIYK